MDSENNASSLVDRIESQLHRSEQDGRPVVVMTCGIAGAGKSTLSKAIASRHPNFTRLSVDTINRETHGLYNIDYPPSKHDEYLDICQDIVKQRLHDLLAEGKRDVILDLSFWNKEYRDEYKALIEKDGGRYALVFLDADREVLWERIRKRRAARDRLSVDDGKRDGDSAYDISEETFEMYCSGFERPDGEGEMVIKVI